MPVLHRAALSAAERQAMTAFQACANQVYRFWWPLRHSNLTATLFREGEPDSASLIPEVDFRSLTMAVRLAYLKSEKGRVESIFEILRSIHDIELDEHVVTLEKDWSDLLTGKRGFHYQSDSHVFAPRTVLDTWLNAACFHQDAKRQDSLRVLRSFDPLASLSLQVMVMGMARLILNLDALIRAASEEAQRDYDQAPDHDISGGML